MSFPGSTGGTTLPSPSPLPMPAFSLGDANSGIISGLGDAFQPSFFDRLNSGISGLQASPLFRLGMNLLQQGGPSTTPHSFGQDLAGAFNALGPQLQAQTAAQMAKTQQGLQQDASDTHFAGVDFGQTLWDKNLDPAGNPLQKPGSLFSPEQSIPGQQPVQRTAANPVVNSGPPLAPIIQPQLQGGFSGSGLAGGATAASGFQGFPPASPQQSAPVPAGPIPAPTLSSVSPPAMQQGQPAPIASAPPQMAGVSPSYAADLRHGENAGSYNWTGPNSSSAKGAYQFTDDTWNATAKKLGLDPADHSPENQDKMELGLREENAATLKANGLPVSDTNLKALHLLGADKGIAFLKVKDSTPTSMVLPKSFIENNKKLLKGKTVGEAKEAIADHYAVPGGSDQPVEEKELASAADTTQQSPTEMISTFASMPKKVKQDLMLGAAYASGGDRAEFAKLFGKAIMEYTLRQEKPKTGNKYSNVAVTKDKEGNVAWRGINNETDRLETVPDSEDIQKLSVAGQGKDYDLENPADRAAVARATQIYRKQNKLPPSRGNAGLIRAIIDYAPIQAQEEGKNIMADLTDQMDLKADATSMAKMKTLATNVRQFELTMLKNMDTVEREMPGGVGTFAPILNKYIRRGLAALGDEQIPSYNSALITVVDEYAKILAGASGGAMTTDASRTQAAGMFNENMTKEQILNVFNKVIRPDAENRHVAVLETAQELRDQMSKMTTFGGAPKQPIGPGIKGAPATVPGTVPWYKDSAGNWTNKP